MVVSFMRQTITINDTLLKNASKYAGTDDFNEIINIALHELTKSIKFLVKVVNPQLLLQEKAISSVI
jgi:hypothetical protein